MQRRDEEAGFDGAGHLEVLSAPGMPDASLGDCHGGLFMLGYQIEFGLIVIGGRVVS